MVPTIGVGTHIYLNRGLVGDIGIPSQVPNTYTLNILTKALVRFIQTQGLSYTNAKVVKFNKLINPWYKRG